MGINVHSSAKRGAIYARVSTREQERNSESLQHQTEIMRRYAALRFPAIELIEFQDVGTARKTNRRAYRNMMATARAGRINVIMVTEQSRLWRNLQDAITELNKLQAWGCDIVILNMGIDTSTPIGKFQFSLFGALAQFESDQTSDRVRRVIDHQKRQGLKGPGIRPYGWKPDEEGKLIRDPEEQSVIEWVSSRRRNGETWEAVAQALNGMGKRTATGRDWDRGGLRLVMIAAEKRRAVEADLRLAAGEGTTDIVVGDAG